MAQIISAILFSLSANIDNIAFGISYGIKKINISLPSLLILSSITSIITLISVYLGSALSFILPACIGAYFLIFIGTVGVITTLLKKNDVEQISDTKNIGIKQLIILAFSLSYNNIATGIAASLMGIDITITIVFTFIFCNIFLSIGNTLGSHLSSKANNTKKYDIISSIILIILGIFELLFG